MIYKNVIGGFEYYAVMNDCAPMGITFEPKYQKVYGGPTGERMEKVIARLFVSFNGKGFDLSDKKYFYESEKEYYQAVDNLISDMSDRGFEVSVKQKGTISDPRKMYVHFVHTETKEAAEQAKAERERKYTEKGYVRFGKIPKGGKSYNYRDNFYEQGVSVFNAMFSADGDYIIKPQNGVQLFGMYEYKNRPAYRVFGKEIGVGSDGEPVLEVQRAIKIEQLKKQAAEKKSKSLKSDNEKRDHGESRENQIVALKDLCNRKLSDEIVKDQTVSRADEVLSAIQKPGVRPRRTTEKRSCKGRPKGSAPRGK